MELKDKLSIVCFSGNFDRAVAAFTLATGAAAPVRD
jgi:peroxiredoxin family protein